MEKERQSDEIGEGDFGELKQDLQAIRFEMLSQLKQTREDSLRLINYLNGSTLRGEEFFKNFKSDPLARFSISKQGSKNMDFKLNEDFNLNDSDKEQIMKIGASEPSTEVNSSSASSETGADSNGTGSSVSNSSDSLNSNGTFLSDISLYTANILNENKKFDVKNFSTNELDIIKEEDGHF